MAELQQMMQRMLSMPRATATIRRPTAFNRPHGFIHQWYHATQRVAPQWPDVLQL